MAVPKLRFKADDGSEYPDWKRETLGNLGNFMKGAPLSKSNISADGSPMILYGELYTTYNEIASDIKNHTNIDVDKKYLSQIGDVVIPTSGETPEEISTATCVMKNDVVLAGDLYIYRTSSDIDGRMMSYLLNYQINNDIARIAQGKSIVHVQANELYRMVVQYPSSANEQGKIIDCLATIDTVIANCQSEVDAWEKYKRGVMQQLFSQKMRFKADDGSEFPNWKEVQLSDVGTAKSGIGFPEKYQGEDTLEIPFYKVSDMNLPTNAITMTQSNNYVSSTSLNEMHIHQFTEQAIIFAKVGMAILQERKRIANAPFLIDNNMMAFSPSKEYPIKFIYQLFQNLKLSKYIQPGALPSFNAKDILSIKIELPCLKEQQKIADCLSAFDEVIDKAKQKLEAYKQLKKGLLQQMFV